MVTVHLHDNDGTKDSHLAIGDGKINFRLLLSRMKRIRYQGPFILEVHKLEGLKRSVRALRTLIRGAR